MKHLLLLSILCAPLFCGAQIRTTASLAAFQNGKVDGDPETWLSGRVKFAGGTASFAYQFRNPFVPMSVFGSVRVNDGERAVVESAVVDATANGYEVIIGYTDVDGVKRALDLTMDKPTPCPAKEEYGPRPCKALWTVESAVIR